MVTAAANTKDQVLVSYVVGLQRCRQGWARLLRRFHPPDGNVFQLLFFVCQLGLHVLQQLSRQDAARFYSVA